MFTMDRIGRSGSPEYAKGRRADEPVITGDNRLKSDVLAKAGLTVLEANRYEQLTGGTTERGQAAAKGAVEVTFAKARETKTPVSAKELRTAIKKALPPYFGPQPRVRQPSRGIVSVALSGVQNSAHPLTSAPSYSRTIRPPEQ